MFIATFFMFLRQELATTLCPLTFVTPYIQLGITTGHRVEYSTVQNSTVVVVVAVRANIRVGITSGEN